MRSERGRARGDDDPGVLAKLGWGPRDAVAFVVGVFATGAILINVLFLQAGPHPAPMVKTSLLPPPGPQEATSNIGPVAPRPRTAEPAPAEIAASKADALKAEPAKHELAKGAPA